jgi:hypothetical protein
MRHGIGENSRLQEVKMFGKKLFCFVVAVSLAFMFLASGTRVLAGSDRVTRGDVEATLHTWNTGLRALRFIGNATAAAPLEGFQQGLIHPLFSDGTHYCVEDWHVIMSAWVAGGEESFTPQDAVAELSGIESTFILDGMTLPITETPIVRRVAGGNEFGYAFGSILSPSDLGVGEHTLTYMVAFPEGDADQVTITFYVDPSGSGACVP